MPQQHIFSFKEDNVTYYDQAYQIEFTKPNVLYMLENLSMIIPRVKGEGDKLVLNKFLLELTQILSTKKKETRDIFFDNIEDVMALRKSAEQGDGESQYRLGVLCRPDHSFVLSLDNNALALLGSEDSEKESFCLFLSAAKQGYVKAQYEVGKCYLSGLGVKRNQEEAINWFHKAAEQGDAEAQENVADLYYNSGKASKQDELESIKWYRKAAEQGNARAQYMLGIIYSKEQGAAQDKDEALKWFRMAADQGHVQAQFRLGSEYYDRFYLNGQKDEDRTEAIKWLQKIINTPLVPGEIRYGNVDALLKNLSEMDEVVSLLKKAEEGNAKAQYELAEHYAKGFGVKKNNDEAIKWFCKAAEQGYSKAYYELGAAYYTRYQEGGQKDEDREEAIKWLQKGEDVFDMNASILLLRILQSSR